MAFVQADITENLNFETFIGGSSVLGSLEVRAGRTFDKLLQWFHNQTRN